MREWYFRQDCPITVMRSFYKGWRIASTRSFGIETKRGYAGEWVSCATIRGRTERGRGGLNPQAASPGSRLGPGSSFARFISPLQFLGESEPADAHLPTGKTGPYLVFPMKLRPNDELLSDTSYENCMCSLITWQD